MLARVQTLHQPAEKLDELTQVAREQLPTAHELPGFEGMLYLLDRDNAKAVVISLWETEEHLRRLEAHTAVREHVETEVGVQSPRSEIFDVALRAS